MGQGKDVFGAWSSECCLGPCSEFLGYLLLQGKGGQGDCLDFHTYSHSASKKKSLSTCLASQLVSTFTTEFGEKVGQKHLFKMGVRFQAKEGTSGCQCYRP